MSPKREPIIWIGLVIIILQLVESFIRHDDIATVDTLFNSAITIIGALIGRNLVTPVQEVVPTDIVDRTYE